MRMGFVLTPWRKSWRSSKRRLSVRAPLGAGGCYAPPRPPLRSRPRARRNALVAALREHLPEASVRAPGGGFFVWVDLPEDTPSQALLPYAEAAGMSFIPGANFHL